MSIEYFSLKSQTRLREHLLAIYKYRSTNASKYILHAPHGVVVWWCGGEVERSSVTYEQVAVGDACMCTCVLYDVTRHDAVIDASPYLNMD